MKNKITPLPEGGRLRFVLVYQGGIANVFQVDCFNMSPFGRNAKRVYYGPFRTAENIAYGAGIAGAIITTAACNQAGDITNSTWSDNLEEQPFSDEFHPVFFTLGEPETLNEAASLRNSLETADFSARLFLGWMAVRITGLQAEIEALKAVGNYDDNPPNKRNSPAS